MKSVKSLASFPNAMYVVSWQERKAIIENSFSVHILQPNSSFLRVQSTTFTKLCSSCLVHPCVVSLVILFKAWTTKRFHYLQSFFALERQCSIVFKKSDSGVRSSVIFISMGSQQVNLSIHNFLHQYYLNNTNNTYHIDLLCRLSV